MAVRIAPSILAADFARLAEEIARVEAAGADWIHVDVMDGHFVPNLSIGPPVIEALKAVTHLPLDVHVMVQDPDALLPALLTAGSDRISVHFEACQHLHRTVQAIKAAGRLASVGLNPETPVGMLHDILPELDMALLMAVNPGFSGQPFMPSTLGKIRALKQHLSVRHLNVAIEVDGGISPTNAGAVQAAGADILAVGTAIFRSADYGTAIRALRARP